MRQISCDVYQCCRVLNIYINYGRLVRCAPEPINSTSIYIEVQKVIFLVTLVCLSVCLFVCLSVCGQHYSKSYERIGMKFNGGVLGSTMKNWLQFGGDLVVIWWYSKMSKWAKNTIIEVAYKDRTFGVSLSPPVLNIITLGNMGAMICLDQGGLHSCTASSSFSCTTCLFPKYTRETYNACKVDAINSYSTSHYNWCTVTLWNRIMTAQCEGMGEVGSARYEPVLLPPCPSIRILSYSNCQEIHSR